MNSYNDEFLHSSAILRESCTCSEPAATWLAPRAQRDGAGSQGQSEATLSRRPFQYFAKALKSVTNKLEHPAKSETMPLFFLKGKIIVRQYNTYRMT